MSTSAKSGFDDDVESKESAFYVDAAKYWEQVPPTGILQIYHHLRACLIEFEKFIVDGMLGGLSSISDIDLKGSQRFLNSIYQVVLVAGI